MKTDRESLSKILAVFGAGLLSFFGQGAVFRDFLGVFNGGELASGLFLAFWLLWLCAGSLAALKLPKAADFGVRNFSALLLAYLPALALQALLCFFAREMAGVPRFEQFGFLSLLLASFAASAPLSLLTGFLFVAAGLLLRDERIPALKVYAIEALGSCVGALAGSGLLCLGLGDASMILAGGVLAAVFSLAAGFAGKSSWKVSAAVLALCLAALAGGLWWRMDAALDAFAFKRLVPDGKFEKAFSTRQARYLLGSREGQQIVAAWGSAIDNIPGREAAKELAASLIVQARDAKKVAVAGENSLGLCLVLAHFGEAGEIQLTSLDPEYPSALIEALPAGTLTQKELSVIRPSNLDPKALLEQEKGFDLVVVNPVNMASLSTMRFTSKDFLKTVKDALTPSGVLAFSFPSSEDFLGKELAKVGASVFLPLREIFPETVYKAGDPATVFASLRKGILCEDPEILPAKASVIDGFSELCAPQALPYLFDRDRAELHTKQLLALQGEAPQPFGSALAYLSKRLGAPWRGAALETFGLLVFGLLAILLFFRIVALLDFDFASRPKGVRVGRATSLDAFVALALAGFAGAGLFIALLAKRQYECGSLMVDYGLLNASFMAGLFAGAWLAASLLKKFRETLFSLFALPLGCLLLGGFAASPAFPVSLIWAQLFLAGALCGALAAAASGELKKTELSDASLSAGFECADCFGGCLGGLLAAFSLIPAFGLGCELAFWGAPLAGAVTLSLSARRSPPPVFASSSPLGLALALLACADIALFAFRERLDLTGWRLTFALLGPVAAAVFLRFGLASQVKEPISMSNRSESDKGETEALASFDLRAWRALSLCVATACLLFAAFLAFGGWRAPASASLPPLPSLPSPAAIPPAESKAAAPASSDAVEDAPPPKSNPRKIDEKRIKELIDAGRLSSKEASYWISAEVE